MNNTATIVTISSSIFVVLIAILGFLVKATIKWTVVTVEVKTIRETVNGLTSQLVAAVTKDNDHETRLQLLEKGHR